MASRKAEKEAARQRRLEQERVQRAATQRRQRLSIVGGLVVAVVAVAVVLVIVLGGSSSSSPSANAAAATKAHSPKAQKAAAAVESLLKGIPQHGNTLGNPKAKVTFTEYGDLECSVCDAFALDGAETKLIENEVRQGKVKLVYKSLETATSEQPNASTLFPRQQIAAYAAGAQNKAWNYIELFYHLQGQEGTPYVTEAYLTGLAKQIPGLNVAKWQADRSNPKYAKMVMQEAQQAKALGISATPGLVASGPTSRTKPVEGLIGYPQVQAMVKEVS